MQSDQTFSFSDDLAATLAEAWRLLQRGVADRRHGFHHPVLATTDLDGRPQARTVILRAVDPAKREIVFHTDARSAKIAELAANPKAALQVYDEKRKIQLRLNGEALVHQNDEIALAHWRASQRMSRVCYSVHPAPGARIDRAGGFALQQQDVGETEADIPGYANFAVVVVRLDSLEWLFLAGEGHRRARFGWVTDGGLTSTWLAP